MFTRGIAAGRYFTGLSSVVSGEHSALGKAGLERHSGLGVIF